MTATVLARPTTFRPGGPKRFAHQRSALRKIIETRGICALLMEPGTGKTAPTLDYASLLALKSPTGEARVLVFAPLAAVDTWVIQSRTYPPSDVSVWAEALGGSIRRKTDVMTMRGPDSRDRGAGTRAAQMLYRREAGQTEESSAKSPDGLPGPRLILLSVNLDVLASRREVTRSKTMADVVLRAVKEFSPDLIVIDESQRIKSPTSNMSRLAGRLAPLARRRMILTGTVMPHSPLDVFGQWRFLNPDAFATRLDSGSRSLSFGRFQARYAKLGGWMGKQVVGFQNIDEMQDIMSRNSYAARKVDCLDLPPVTRTQVAVDLSPSERKAYDEMKASLAARLEDGSLATAPNRLTQMMRLRQITSGYLKGDDGQIRVMGESKVKAIASVVNDTLGDERRVVVFCHFRPEIELLMKALACKGTEVLTFTGDTHNLARTAIRQRFGSSDPARLVLVAQMRTMSLAVNELVTASHAVYGSLSIQRDDLVQSRDRLNRIGQTRPVTFWEVVVPDSVDEVILSSHENRTNLEDAMIRYLREA